MHIGISHIQIAAWSKQLTWPVWGSAYRAMTFDTLGEVWFANIHKAIKNQVSYIQCIRLMNVGEELCR